MRTFAKTLAAAAMATALVAVPAAHAGTEGDPAQSFIKMCDADKDGMVSKAEVMKAVEKMFDKHDGKRMGKLDQKQVDAFLKELTKTDGAR